MTSRLPSAVWIEQERLRPSRWAAEYYKKEYTDLESELSDCEQPLSQLGDLARLFTGPFGSELPSSLYGTPDGVPLLRVQNIGELFLNEDDLARIPGDVHRQLARSRLSPGDLAFAKAGRLGAMIKIPDHIKDCNITQHIVGVNVRIDRVLGSYLAAFFLSRFGRFQLERQGVGTLIKYLGIEETRQASVVVPDRKIQQYIGAEVELAERCRAEGVCLRQRANAILREHWDLVRLEQEAVRLASDRAHMVPTTLFGDRLDAEFYQPWHLHLADELDRRDCWTLRDLIHPPAKGVQPEYESEGSIPALTVTHIDPFVIYRSDASQAVTQKWLEANERARIHPEEVLLTVTGPPLGEAVVVEGFHIPAAINSHIARIPLQRGFRFPNLVAAMLNSQLGQWQTKRYCKGIRQKELYPEDLLCFRFPKLPPNILASLEDDFRKACVVLEKARVLVAEAKADVEALIEGTMDTAAILSGRLKPPTYEELMKTVAGKGAR